MSPTNLPRSSRFRFLDRGKQDTVVLVPGWATDHRIFTHLDYPANYLITTSCVPADFAMRLTSVVSEQGLRRVSLFGVSMGAFLAAQWAAQHPQQVDTVTLVSVREQYPPADIDRIAGYIAKNKKAYLARFYAHCFSAERPRGDFERDLFSEYCDTFSAEYLLETLAYLREARIETTAFASLSKVRIMHGEYDRIAPFAEAYELSTRLYHADFLCIPGAGHFPFLGSLTS